MKRSGTTTKILRIAYMTCALGGPNARLAHIFSLYLAQFLKHRIMSNFFFFERNLLLVVHYFYRFIVLSFYRFIGCVKRMKLFDIPGASVYC